METCSVLEIYRKLQKNNIKFVDYVILQQITKLQNNNTLYQFAGRMRGRRLLISLNNAGKFLVADSNPSEFEIANFLYMPSYVSLESALSFYGILPQFVYSMVSITTKKTKKFIFSKKEYAYSQIKKHRYWGYIKKDDFLIAEPEKALLDSLYFFSKGIISLDLKELDLSNVNKKILFSYAKKFKNKFVTSLVTKLNL